jgi:hypothetical protein
VRAAALLSALNGLLPALLFALVLLRLLVAFPYSGLLLLENTSLSPLLRGVE